MKCTLTISLVILAVFSLSSCEVKESRRTNDTSKSSDEACSVKNIEPQKGHVSTSTELTSNETGSLPVDNVAIRLDKERKKVRTLPTQEFIMLTSWVDGFFLNTQLHHYADCTNMIASLYSDNDLYWAVHAEVGRFQQKFGTVYAFMRWYASTNETERLSLLAEMKSHLTENTLPFYLFALSTIPRDERRNYMIKPDELIPTVVDPMKLWDAGLVGLANIYYEFDGEEALIMYWDVIAKHRPELLAASTVHKMHAAYRLGDAERCMSFLIPNMNEVRKAQWTIERAIAVLSKLSHPQAVSLSNQLVTGENTNH